MLSQNSDLQRVWRLVQELSAQLKANQLETERLRRFVELNPPVTASTHASSNGSSEVDGGGAGEGKGDSRVPDELRHAYSILLDENTTLKAENEDVTRLCAEYEVGLTCAMEQIREHAYDMTMSTLDLHRNYASQLDAERKDNDKLKSEVVELQGQMHHLSGLVRNALHEYSAADDQG